ncbi:MAG: DUF4112 domain-containing protein [Pseudomonadota bacterium]
MGIVAGLALFAARCGSIDTERQPTTVATVERQRLVRRLDRLAWLLDASLPIPFTRYRFGLDSLIGLVPVVGDALGALLSTSIVVGAWRLGAPWRVLLPMIGNVFIETIVGAVPIVGDLFDIGYKANRRNVARLIAYLDDASEVEPPRRWSALLVLAVTVVAAIFLALTLLALAIVWSAVTALIN